MTARATKALSEGNLYFYDLEFREPLGITQLTNAITTPFANPVSSPLAYPPFILPSFALPPKDPNLLRLIQGSCRMPHADGQDTFPILDDLIKDSALNAFARPHQLLLTGDQIYADDVADTLLLMLTDAGDTNEVLARKPHPALFHESNSLQYHFTVEGPGHQVIFTDTRTWRSFPDGGHEPSEILPKEQFKHQILDQPKTLDRVLLVVVSTNAPPVEPIRAATRHDRLSHLGALLGSSVNVTLEIEAAIPNGTPENVVRTVTENARTLKFDCQGFETD